MLPEHSLSKHVKGAIWPLAIGYTYHSVMASVSDGREKTCQIPCPYLAASISLYCNLGPGGATVLKSNPSTQFPWSFNSTLVEHSNDSDVFAFWEMGPSKCMIGPGSRELLFCQDASKRSRIYTNIDQGPSRRREGGSESMRSRH